MTTNSSNFSFQKGYHFWVVCSLFINSYTLIQFTVYSYGLSVYKLQKNMCLRFLFYLLLFNWLTIVNSFNIKKEKVQIKTIRYSLLIQHSFRHMDWQEKNQTNFKSLGVAILVGVSFIIPESRRIALIVPEISTCRQTDK